MEVVVLGKCQSGVGGQKTRAQRLPWLPRCVRKHCNTAKQGKTVADTTNRHPRGYNRRKANRLGSVAEWFKALVLKTGVG